jgi:tetratricopeptide (TPR) repeat protein
MPISKDRHTYCYRWIFAFLLLSFAALSPAIPAEAAKPKRTPRPIEQADEALWLMNYQKADSLYSLELRNNPCDADLHWKMARLQVSLGESIPPGNTEGRMLHYRKAAEYARTGVALDSTNARGHSWLAVSLGLMADKIGTKEKLKRAKEIKQELDTALRLNPNDETALSMLGSYYREAAKIGWFKRMLGNAFLGEVPKGDFTLAEKAFRKAISIDSRVIRNYHELALICIESGRKEEAIALMNSALDKPIMMESDRKRIEQMRELLKKLGKE